MSQLIYRRECEHGSLRPHGGTRLSAQPRCPGAVAVLLDPDKVLWNGMPHAPVIHVADVLAVLDREAT